MTQTFARELLARAGWTALQAFLSVLAVAQIPHTLAELHALLVAGLAAAGGAVLSMLKTTVVGAKYGAASVSQASAIVSGGAHAVSIAPGQDSAQDSAQPPSAEDVLARANAIHPADSPAQPSA